MNATDSIGLVTTANMTVRVLPPGVPQFFGLAPGPTQGYTTAGDDNVTLIGQNFLIGKQVNATYSSPALGVSFTMTVCAF